jgi:CMP-N-acetylneuraminic acid synthetase/NAD(P)-dependent dehydrogenase (short-subunit alcohol dehydrogenase family)
MKTYGFIFCRSGSKGLPNKNIKKMNGISLLKRNIILLRKSKNIDKIFVSTDSEEYKKEALEAGALVPVLRPKELAEDKSSEIDAWKFMVNYLKENNDDFDVFISLPVVSPLKKLEDIDNIINQFKKNDPDLLITVKNAERNPYFNIIKEVGSKITIFDETMANMSNRQNFPEVFDITTVAYVMKKDILLNLKNNLFNSNLKIDKYIIDKISAIDIDDLIDFKTAEYFHKERIKSRIDFSVLNNILLDEKIAVITGGIGKIGEKIVETLLELNCHVIIIDFESDYSRKKIEELNNKFETNIDFFNIDLSKKEKINNFCKQFLNKYKKIDILINCAALVGTSGLKGWAEPFEDQSTEAFDLCMDVNVKAPMLLIQGLIKGFKKSVNPKIINISSIYGIRGNDFSLYEDTAMKSPIAYSISKAGLNIMTKYLASWYGSSNLCINSIVLGGIFRNQDTKFVERYNNKTPLGRMGTEDDIKGIISFLSSNLSNYITGQEFVVDGGITCKF